MTLSTLPASLLSAPCTTELSERLDAAKALLGVSPSTTTTLNGIAAFATMTPPLAIPKNNIFAAKPFQSDADTLETASLSTSMDSTETTVRRGRSRSNSAGLDALAFLATKEQATLQRQQSQQQQQQHHDARPSFLRTPAINTTSTCIPSVISSLSNHYKHFDGTSTPSTASTSSSDSSDCESMPPPATQRSCRRPRSVSNPEGMDKWVPRTNRVHFVLPESILEEEMAEASAAIQAQEEQERLREMEEESHLSQDELLRRARSRLLEDLSEGSITGEKGTLTLPHSLPKYKNVYNKNGRVGIYTPNERSAIIARFHDKRSRRVWNKKIRYNCRKNLADRRMRVKGRFVKRATEQAAKRTKPASIPECDPADEVDLDDIDLESPDSPFSPTEDMPFRRRRRHTIT